jgi:hypothetical protein
MMRSALTNEKPVAPAAWCSGFDSMSVFDARFLSLEDPLMQRCFTLRRWLALLCLALAGLPMARAQAQTAPPLKPGLWQVKTEREVDGQKEPDPMEQMKNMPPELRKQMEAVMKNRGVELGGGGLHKICHSRDTLERGRWKGDADGCKTDILSQSDKAWKWHTACPQPVMEGDGEALFTSPESYTVKMLLTMKDGSQSRKLSMNMAGTWLGADCGGLKPMQLPAKAN